MEEFEEKTMNKFQQLDPEDLDAQDLLFKTARKLSVPSKPEVPIRRLNRK